MKQIENTKVWFEIFGGETLRVGSGPMMPWAFLWTFPNGTQIIGNGAYHEYLRIIADADGLTLNWVDVLYQEADSVLN